MDDESRESQLRVDMINSMPNDLHVNLHKSENHATQSVNC